MSLEEAVKDQIDKLDSEEKPVVEETPSGEENETGTEGGPGSEEDALGDDELKEAANLYKLLRDKDTRKLVLRTLGEKAGLFETPPQTPKEVSAVKRGIKEILADKLGKEYDFLIPKLGEALEAILEDVKESQSQSIGQIQQEQINTQVVHELSELARETKGTSRGLEARMSALSQKFPPGDGLSVKEYIRGLYAMASDGKPATSANKIAERINRNSKDVPSRLQSGTGSLKDSPRNLGKLSIDQSVKHALKQLGMDKD